MILASISSYFYHIQNLQRTVEQGQSTEKRLSIELDHTKEVNQSQVKQLQVRLHYCNLYWEVDSSSNAQSELETLTNEKIKITTKHKKLLSTYQVSLIL